MGIFDKHWSDEIAEVTESSEYQTAIIRIYDTTNMTGDPYDIETGTGGPQPTMVWEGQARFVGFRAAIDAYNQEQANKSSIQTVRIQIPQHATGLVHRNWKVFFVEVPKNPSLMRRTATITSDIQGASAATRTFEAAVDGDAVLPE